jgi:hypothetical protein
MSAFFDAATMADLTALDLSAMPSTATISHTAPGTVNPDGSTEPGTVTTTDVPARFVDTVTSMRETLISMKVTAQVDGVLNIPLGTDVTTDDTVTMGGVTFQIVGTNENVSYRTSIALAVRKS